MAFTFVNQANDFTYSANGPLTIPISVTKGNLLVAWMTADQFASNIQTLIFDGRNIWQQILQPYNNTSPSGYGVVTAWYTIVQETETISLTFFSIFNTSMVSGAAWQATKNSTTPGNRAAQVVQFSGQASNPFEGFTTSTGSSTSPASAITVSGTADLILGIVVPGNSTNDVETAGWTNTIAPATAYAAIYAIKSAAGTFTPTYTRSPSSAWTCLALAFRAASATSTYTISGSLGSLGANATVLFISTTTDQIFTATADVSGNYTSPGLVNDTYVVQPQVIGVAFSSQSQAVSGSNVTLNFTGTAVQTVLALTTTISDTMIRANENPLSDGGNWAQDGTPVPPWDKPCQLLNNECELSDATIYANYTGPWGGNSISVWVGTPPANDQFAQYQIDALSSVASEWAAAQLAVRSPSNDTTGYTLSVRNNGDGTAQVLVFYFETNGGASTPSGIWLTGPFPYGVWTNPSVSFSLGDTFGLAAVGGAGNTVLYILHNGTVIGNYLDTANNVNLTSGSPVIQLLGNTVSDVKVSHFTAGSLTSSFPSVQSLSISPETVAVGYPTTGTVTLSVIPTGNTAVTLSSSNTAVATVPASVTVLAGNQTATFSVTTLSPGGTIITASLSGSVTADVTVTNNSITSPATNGVVYMDLYFGPNLAETFTNPYSWDLIQIITKGGRVVWNLNALGVASINPTNPTPQTLLWQFSGPNFAQTFSNNPGSLDLFQIRNEGNKAIFWVNYLGNVFTA